MPRLFANLTPGSRRRRRQSYSVAAEDLESRVVLTSMDGLGMTAASAIVIDSDGNTVGELNLDYQNAMASTTKIMTALIAIEAAENTAEAGISLDDVVTVGFYPTAVQGFTFDPTAGEQFLLRDLLTISMVSSDNEITQAIAEHVVGQTSTSVATGVAINAQFVALMNARAAELGMDDTNFRSPHGRDPEDLPELGTVPGPNRGHFSTAMDMTRLGQIAMQNETLAEIAGVVSDSVESILPDGTIREYNFSTANGLLLSGSAYPGAEGVKGGMTGRAGRVLVSQATILGETMNATVMNSDSWPDRNFDSHKALNFGFEQKFGWTVDETAFTVETLTGIYDVNSGVYTITGTDAHDNIQVWRYANDMMVQVNGVSEWLPIADLTQIDINARGGDDYIFISGTPAGLPIEIDGGEDDDTIVIGASEGLDIVDTPLYVAGGAGIDELWINDMGASRAQTYVLRQGGVIRSSYTLAGYTTIEELHLDGTNYDDFFEINGLDTEIELSLNGRLGLDTLVADDHENTWDVTDQNRGELNGNEFRDIESLIGGSSTDVFAFSNLAGLSGSVDGGSATDELDYSKFDEGISVDLSAGTASNIGGEVESIENVTGTPYRDKLLGNSKSNLLQGLLGDDLLVGRGGKDHLINKAGNAVMIGGLGEDKMEGGRDTELMIASATTYDQSLNALDGILSQWANTKLSTAQRMEVLSKGFWYGREFVRLDTSTVEDDKKNIDGLFGNGGLDWLWTAEEKKDEPASKSGATSTRK